MYESMKRMIINKQQSKEKVEKKLNMFYRNDQLTDEQYEELMQLNQARED